MTLMVIGGGLAGSEAAWQAAERGVKVRLFEMRPVKSTPAHVTDRFGELVCSNSLGSTLPDRAPGVLKAELTKLGSLLLANPDIDIIGLVASVILVIALFPLGIQIIKGETP